MIVFACLVPWFGGLQAATNTVTFKITRVKELQCSDGVGGINCPNDYYPKANINNQGLDNGKDRGLCCASETDFSPPDWIFTTQVNAGIVPFPIHVELWDQDDVSSDDPIDIGNNGDFEVNLNTCTWTLGSSSGLLNTQSSTSGSGDDSAQLYFMITTDAPTCIDSDGDGLLDIWETGGLNGVNLQAMGADPNKRDLFLQLDFLALPPPGHTHQPLQAAIQMVVQAFANAPVVNPDGSSGIQLHIDVGPIYGAGVVTKVPSTSDPRVVGTYGDYGGGGNLIPEAGNTIVDYAGNGATNFFTLKKMNTNRDNIFRYGLFVHQTNSRAPINDCTSGLAKGAPGVNFMVSLGGIGPRNVAPAGLPPVIAVVPCWGLDIPGPTGQSVGSVPQQAGTLMHEFGHTLGLRHGGDDDTNNKPNYFSVMSYLRFPKPGTVVSEQFCGVFPIPTRGLGGGCDYSSVKLPPTIGLDETSLDECLGIDGGTFGVGPIDLNGNGVLEGATCSPPNTANISANINRDTPNGGDANNNGVQDPGEPALLGTLNGFNDWFSLVYNPRTVTDFTTAGTPVDHEPDPQTIDAARTAHAEITQPKLKITTTGPAGASPGETLTYNVMLENRLEDGARGPAVDVAVTDTKPDLSAEVISVGTVVLRATANKAVAFEVPCTATDGSVLTNVARAHGIDLLNNPIDSSSVAQTEVHAPVLVLLNIATVAVNSGEAITYNIQFENTGTGTAFNVVVTDTLPRDVYYSLALDQGHGPRPVTVTLNGNGTRTLVWNIGTMPPHSRPIEIQFTARPTLLALEGTAFTNHVTLAFQKGAACAADMLTASAGTKITVVTPRREPHDFLRWMERAKQELAETLARIQATDQRFDTDAGGALTQTEVKKGFSFGNLWVYLFHWNAPVHLDQRLLALYFNLATRRVNADTPLEREHDTPPGLLNVRDAALNAQATLAVPYSEATESKYHRAKELLEEINQR